jgi:hypothetical protein
MTPTAKRLMLLMAGYSPIPVNGKAPPLKGWQNLGGATREQIKAWGKNVSDAQNTGCLTRTMPTLDIDILNEEAARAVEDYVRESFEGHGLILSRIGKPPKRAIPFRTDAPFQKIIVNLTAPNGSEEKIEFLGDGQQVVVHGTHPDTSKPYSWHGGELGDVALADLPPITETGAQTLADEVAALLISEFGYTKAAERPKKANGGDKEEGAGAADWQYLYDNIREGRELHDSLRNLSAKLIASGMNAGGVTNLLRGLMQSSSAPRDKRFALRCASIPTLVASAVELQESGDDSKAKKRATKTATPTFCAEELKAMTFAPIKYVVPGIIVEGLTLFAGKPKVGKSWLCLHAGIAVAQGSSTLGDIECEGGDVLYCALEDSKRRLQTRMTTLLGISQAWPARFYGRCDLPRLGDGGLDIIRDWIKARSNPRMIIIDTLAMVRPPKKRDDTAYDADYNAVLTLRDLANEFSLAIVLVSHLRKADADDAFDTVSGTLGLTAAVDSVLILRHEATGHNVTGHNVLLGKGRDMPEFEKAVERDQVTCLWHILGDASDLRRSAERTKVLNALREATEPVSPNVIATETRMRTNNVSFLLAKLCKEGVAKKVGYGKYQLAD